MPEKKPQKSFSLLIDPFGDAKEAGRDIDDAVERVLTLESALQLKKNIEELVPGAKVIVAKAPGEMVEPLQIASFANKLKVDLFVSLHLFQHSAKENSIWLYTAGYNKRTDIPVAKKKELVLLPYDQAYKQSLGETGQLVQAFYQNCLKESATAKELKQTITCAQPQAIPF